MRFFKLDENHQVVECSKSEARAWEDKDNCSVGWSKNEDGIKVSTIFRGGQRSYTADEQPVFESMVFGGCLDGVQEFYPTWEEAVAGHKALCEKAFAPETPAEPPPHILALEGEEAKAAVKELYGALAIAISDMHNTCMSAAGPRTLIFMKKSEFLRSAFPDLEN